MQRHRRQTIAPNRVRLLCLVLSWVVVVTSSYLPVSTALATPAGRARSNATTGARARGRQTIPAPAQSSPAGNKSSRAGQLLVRFRPDASEAQREEILRRSGSRYRTLRGSSGLTLLTYATGENVEATAATLASHPAIEFAEPNYLIKADQIAANDPRAPEQWVLADGEQAGAGINVTRAWEQTTGSAQTVIAVIDSGIDFSHPDLSANQWTNAGEQDNNRDDDGNDLSDDLHGWDFVADGSEIKDELGHGTAVAGIIAAEGNNGVGVTGVMWRAALMSLRVLDGSGTGDVAGAVEAIDYATAHGASVINVSWGAPHLSQALAGALARAGQRGVLVVCSAGNEGNNIEGIGRYPAAYNLPHVISVAATDNSGQLTSWSNWGGARVSIAAPGVDILTTARGGDYRPVTGSSYAAPHVTGVAGLVRTLRPRLSAGHTRALIMKGVRGVAALQGKVASKGVVNAAGTLASSLTLPPGEGRGDGSANTEGEQKNFDQESRVDESRGSGNGNAVSGVSGARGNGQAAVDPRAAAPVRGRPASNLPDLNVLRALRPGAPRARAPIPSTLRNCPPNNPHCSNTINNDDGNRNNNNGNRGSQVNPGGATSNASGAAPQTPLTTSTFKSGLVSIPNLADLYRPILLAALQGEKLYSIPGAGINPADFLREGNVYSVSDAPHTLGGMLPPPASAVAAAQGSPACGAAGNSAAFISQSVPAVMTAGQSYQVSVKMKNTGSTVWKTDTYHRLGAQNPENLSVWRVGRVQLPADVGTCTEATFNFTVTAPVPAATQTYNFQWQMVQDGLQWFGTMTDNVVVTVKAPQYQGYLDAASCNNIGGWAWDASKLAPPVEPDGALEVDIFADDKLLARVPANQYRADLQAAGKGDGRHAFNIVTPPSLRDGNAHQISARVANTTFLPGGAYSLAGTITINGCTGGGTSSLNAPSNLTVMSTSGSQITLSWGQTTGSNSYQVERSTGGAAGGFTLLSTTTSTTFSDNAVSSGTAYLYRVRAINSTTYAASPYGNVALGTAITFQQPNAPEIKAVHFTDLRLAVGAVRAAAGLTNPWGETIAPGGLIKAEHVREMRDGLDEALGVLNLVQATFEDAPLATGANGTYVRQIHVDQLRAASTRASGTGSSSVGNNRAGAGGAAAARVNPLNRTGGGSTDLLSGNFNWGVPLVGLPGRSGLDLGLSLVYNSKVWVRDQASSTVYFNADNGTPAPGFRLGFPVIQQRFWNPQTGGYSYLMITPGGERVELRQDGATNVYYAADSSNLKLIDYAGTMIVQPGDGSELTYGSFPNGYQCTQIKDRNGNLISVGYHGHGGISVVTDTLGRNVTFHYDNNHNVISITQQRGTQTHTWATFGYTTLAIQHAFSGVTVVGPQNGQLINVLSQVGLGDGSYFKFDYNGAGQVSKIGRYSADDHQLAYTAYDFTPETSDCPRVRARKDWALDWNNNAEAVTDFEYAPDHSSGTMTSPDGSLYKEIFATTGWQQGLTTGTEIWAGGVKQKHTATQWTQDSETVGYRLNPRVVESHIYDQAGNHRRTTIEYYPAAKFYLPKDIKEYEANATTVLRRTYLDYNVDYDYTSRHIIGLTSEQRLYGKNPATGSEEFLSKATYTYDETSDNRLTANTVNGTPVVSTQHDATFGTGFDKGRANITGVKRWDVTTLQTQTPTFVESRIGYNVTGSPVFATDAADHKSEISYADSFSDGASRNTFAYPTTTTDPDQAGQQNPQRSLVTYHYDMGLVTRTQGLSPDLSRFATGAVQTMTYDAVGRVERVTNTTSGAYTRFVYAPGQNWTQSFTTVRDAQTESYSIQVFDGAGRAYASAGDFPGGAAPYRGQHTVYDVMGRAVRSSNPTAITSGWEPVDEDLTDDLPAAWHYATQDYDWQGRPTFSTNADGAFNRELSYGGCGCAGGEVVTSRDALGRRQREISDVLGRTVKTQILNGDNNPYSTTINRYNGRDQIVRSRVYEGGAETDSEPTGEASSYRTMTMTYDGHGRLASSQAPIQTSPTSYSYNADDTTSSMTDGRGVKTQFTYNHRHLVTGVTYNTTGVTSVPTSNGQTTPVNAAPAVTFVYDAVGNRTAMTTQNGDGGSVVYTYDQLSRLTDEARQFPGLTDTYTLSYQYTLGGALQSVTNQSSQAGWTPASFSYEYDQAGQMTGVTGTGYGVTRFVSGMSYRAWGALKGLTYGNNITLSQRYDARLQVRHSELARANTQYATASLMQAAYHYAPDGALKYSNDLLDERFDRAYQYDQVGLVKEAYTGGEARNFMAGTTTQPATGPYRQTYTHNVWGEMAGRENRFWSQTDSFIATYANGRRTETGWSYDAAGLLITDPDLRYVNDAAGRNASVFQTGTAPNNQPKSRTIVQRHDGDGQMMRRDETTLSGNWSNTTTTYYQRSSVLGGRVIAELNAAGAMQKQNVYAGDELLATQTAGTQAVWLHDNALTGSRGYSLADGYFAREMEADPMGVDMGLADPFIVWDGGGNLEPERPMLLGGMGEPSGRCTLDGMAIECGQAMRMLDTGSAVQCPNNDCGPRAVTVNITYTSGRTETHRGFVNDPFFNMNVTFTGFQARLAAMGFNHGLDRGFSWAARNAVSYAMFGSRLPDSNEPRGAAFFAPQQSPNSATNTGNPNTRGGGNSATNSNVTEKKNPCAGKSYSDLNWRDPFKRGKKTESGLDHVTERHILLDNGGFYSITDYRAFVPLPQSKSKYIFNSSVVSLAQAQHTIIAANSVVFREAQANGTYYTDMRTKNFVMSYTFPVAVNVLTRDFVGGIGIQRRTSRIVFTGYFIVDPTCTNVVTAYPGSP
jgi:subtilisin family serine protease